MHLVIVRRGCFSTFALLAQAFADDPNVRLIWDRRVRDRRRDNVAASIGERRRRDRRRDHVSDWGGHEYILLDTTVNAHKGPGQEQTVTIAEPRTLAIPVAREDAQQDIAAAVRSDVNVLITGGDPLSRRSLAHWIHRRSARGDGPLLVVDRRLSMAMFSPSDPNRRTSTSLLESAVGGTILIEEIAELTWEQQTELMSFLETTSGDATRHPRIIAATRYWLVDRIAGAQFRADLFYRLNAIHVVLPAGTVKTTEAHRVIA